MKPLTLTALVVSTLALAACGKKNTASPAPAPATVAAASAPAPAPVAAAPSKAEPTEADLEREKKQAAMDYTTMEDKYLNDPRAQWASGATSSSNYGEEKAGKSSYPAANATGKPDGETWSNNHADMGFDWLETTFAKPVSATEVRFVFAHGRGVETISKIELQDTDGKWNTVWSGLSESTVDARGPRTWVVRGFEKTAYKARAVKITIANNVKPGYKEIDAVQLVGD